MIKPFVAISLVVIALLLPSAFSQQTISRPSQIIEIFRHGARGPLSGYDKTWPFALWGKLTPAGKRQQYVMGKYYSEKYPHLLGSGANHSEIYMLSDTTKRCIESAEIQLSGMYAGQVPSLMGTHPVETAIPPFKDSEIHKIASAVHQASSGNSSSMKVPVTVEVVDETQAGIFKRTHGNQCPNGGKWERENAFDKEAKKAWGVFKDTFDAVNQKFSPKKQLKTGFGVSIFGDALLVNIFDHKRNLSDFGIENPELASNFTYAYSWFVFHTEYGQEIQKQLSAFPIIDEMLKQLEAFKKGETHSKKAALYSAHDYNIYAILAAFGVINEECIMANFLSSIKNETLPYPNCYFPFFASNLVVELYNQTDNATYVKMLYNEAPLTLCNGQDFCEYNEFVALARNATGHSTHETYREKCGAKPVKQENKTSQENNKTSLPAPFNIDLNITTPEKKFNIDLNITNEDLMEEDEAFERFVIEKDPEAIEEDIEDDDYIIGMDQINDADIAQFATTDNSNKRNQDTMIKLLVAASLMLIVVILIVVVLKKAQKSTGEEVSKKQPRYNKLTEIKIH